jgi:pyruvate kinase
MARRKTIRKTKIVATIGPACDDLRVLKAMIEAGMNVARLNFSHENHDAHRRRLELIRQASRELSANVGTMIDTKGGEIRTGSVENGTVELSEGSPFMLYPGADRLGDAGGVSVSYPGLAKQVRLGSLILIDDGQIELRVESLEENAIRGLVIRGGELGNHKGLNVPGTNLLLDAMSDANLNDLQFAVDNEMDYIAASFVRTAEDVLEIRRFLEERDAVIPIIAKIENEEGLKNLEQIVAAADGTMVARGDLGVEMPPQQVPVIQKRIIRTTVSSGKPSITATQMLDSMERNPRPTRAEASDVANAILDGSSAVMLSGETARGRYPMEAVRTMHELALQAEASLDEYGYLQQINHLRAAAILTLTESGFTSRSISKYRPACPILAVTVDPNVVRRLAMNWGVTAMLCERAPSDENKIAFGVTRAREWGVVVPGDLVVATAGTSSEAGSTNLIRIVTVS